MKKLLALLLVLMLPCCGAAAETYGLSVSADVDEEILASYVKVYLVDADYTDEELAALTDSLVQCMNGMGIDLSFQEDAMDLRVNLGNGELLNLTVHTTADTVFLTSPMLSGYALWDTLETVEASDAAVFDWTSISVGMVAVLEAWLGGFEPTVTTGVFDGDAYSGGTQCSTWLLTDMDIAELVSGLATEELRIALVQLLSEAGVDAIPLLDSFDALNDRVAEVDAYQYLLRMVTDGADEFVGASMTLLENGSQIGTVSLGKTDKGFKLVLGLGMDEQNYWWEFEGRQSQLQNIMYLSGDSREWIAAKDESFSYLSVANSPLASYILRATLTKSGNRYLWDGHFSLGDVSAYEYLLSSSGSYSPDTGALDCTISLGGSPYEPIRVRITYGESEAIAPLNSTLKLCSLSDAADAALCQELLDKFAANFMARLVKLLPMDLIMTLNQVSLPQ